MNSVRASSLKYNIQETPYSIYFTIRKSINKSTLYQHPKKNNVTSENESLLKKLDELEKANLALKTNFENSVANCDYLENLYHNLEKELTKVRNELENLESARSVLVNLNANANEEKDFLVNKVKDLEAKVLEVGNKDKFESAVAELEALRHAEDKLEEEIKYLEVSDKNQKAINSRLNSEMVRFRIRLIKEKAQESKFF
jgi:chromosome segregation ATPase